jgi:hypothetical protein
LPLPIPFGKGGRLLEGIIYLTATVLADKLALQASTKMFFYCQPTNSSTMQPHAAFDLLWAVFVIDAKRQMPYIS